MSIGFRAPQGENTKPDERELTSAVAGGLVDVGAGYADEIARNPDDLVLAAKGGGLELYERVLSDEQVFSNFQQRRLALLAKEIEVRPGATDKQSVAAADFLRDMLAGINFDHICNKMAYGIFYGYAVGECMWARDGRHWVLDTVKVRKARRFAYDKARRLRLLKKGAMDGILMPDRKFWTFESGSDNDDNPHGVGLASRCYWPAFFKRNGIRFWMLALEKYGAPTAVGKYPVNATQAEKDKLLQAVAAFASVSGLTIPESMDLDLLTSGSGVGGNYDVLSDFMNKSISKVILSQTMTTDDGSSNSQAQVHQGVADDITAADSDLQNSSFMCSAGRWLMDWNYPTATMPILRRKTEPPEDLDKLARRDRILFEMGYRPTQEHIRRTYGDGYEPIPTPQSAAPMDNPKEFAEASDFKAPVDAVDAYLQSDEHAFALEQDMDGLIGDIEAALAGADDQKAALEQLMVLLGVPKDDPFANRLARAGFNARLHGRRVQEDGE